MNKRSALEIARLALQSATIHHEIPIEHPIRVEAKNQGYTYWRIAVTKMDEDVTFNLYTMRPLESNGAFLNDLIANAKWPGDLLEKLSVQVADNEVTVDHGHDASNRTSLKTTHVYSPFSIEPVQEHGIHNARHVADKQLHGGRPKQQVVNPAKQVEYRRLADWYYKSKLSQRDFCREARVSRRKLNTALSFVQKNGP